MTYQKAVERIRELGPITLANAVNSWCNNEEAEQFFNAIRSNVAEAIDYAEGWPDEDRLNEVADAAPDIYNHTRMMELIGTGAYLDTEWRELAGGEESILEMASLALYQVARNVINWLAEQYEGLANGEPEEDDDEDDED